MSSTIEECLAAALDARAELVTPQDLRPLEVPKQPRRHVRTGVLLLAAAATAAVVATPFVLEDGVGTTPAPDPAGPPSGVVSEPTEPEPPEPSEPESPAVPADTIVVDRQKADVDGDGSPDRVRLLLDSPSPDEPGDGFVEVTLAAGRTSVAEMPFGYPGLRPPFDINGDGREQVLLRHTQGGDFAQLLVYTWHEDGLVLARQEGAAPLATEADGVSGHYTDDRGLVSWLSRAHEAGGATYEVQEWTWSVDGDRLVPTPAGIRCKDIGTQPPRPC